MSHELVVSGLRVAYGQAMAVRGADLVAGGGSITALVGPNGAGKSSTLLGVYGSVPASGRILVDGEDISALKASTRARRGVALVPQGRQLFSHLTVRENLQVMMEMLRLGTPAVDDALDRFPILRVRRQSLAGVLSGGEQQMLVVARAMMGSPRVLLLDEMATGLAPMIVQELAATFRALATAGTAIVLAEPNIGALRRWVDRGYVLIRGEVVATDEHGGASLDRAYQQALGVGDDDVADDDVADEVTSPHSADDVAPGPR